MVPAVREDCLAIAKGTSPAVPFGSLLALGSWTFRLQSLRSLPCACAALPRDLAASELFGHTRSAFSGAAGARPGLFRAAEGGTLFLDEVGCLPPELQPMLLRTLEERTVRPVGSDREVAVDARVVAAAQTDLEAAVDNHEFRADLLARLKYIVIAVPPLRNRRGDILRLARHFVPQLRLTTDAAEVLLVWDWPRNVRELRAVAESLRRVAQDRVIESVDLSDRLPGAVARVANRSPTVTESSEPPAARLSDRRALIAHLLDKHGGNVSAVARELGKPRSHVYRWMRRLGIAR